MLTSAEVFEQIIRQQSVQEVMPFLLALPKKEVVSVREKTRKLHKELSEHRQLGKATWGQVGTNAQLEMLFLAGLSTYTSKEALSAPFANQIWMLNSPLTHHADNGYLPKNELLDVVCQLLVHRRPEWLTAWLGDNPRSTSTLSFDVLLILERKAGVTLSERLLALSGVGELVKCGTEASMLRQLSGYKKALVALTPTQLLGLAQLKQHFPWLYEYEQLPSYEDLVYKRIKLNKDLVERAIPLFFEFDIQLDWATCHTTEFGVTKTLNWRDIIIRLVADCHLDRADMLTRCLLALRRDFRRPLLTWFKDLYLGLKPTLAERLARQAELVELLAHPLPLVVNFAMEQLKDVWTEPGFNLAPLLLYADNLLTRPDLKTGLKTLLSGLAKLPKQYPAHAPAIAQLLAAALPHPDGAVQERAAKGLAALLQAKKPLLAADELAETVAAIGTHAELLGSAARTLLTPWLAPTPSIVGGAPAATYAPNQGFVPAISPATAIAPVADWHELLFLTGQVLKHDDPTALERWLDGLLRLQGQLPAGYPAQLEPYLVQVLPFLKGKTGEQAEAILASNHTHGHAGLVQALLLSWHKHFRTLRVPRVPLQATYLVSDPLVTLEKKRLAHAEELLHYGQALPLLSTPTHAPAWVAPTTLVHKLLAYEAAHQELDVADLAVALARTAHSHPGEAEAACRLLPQLRYEGLRALLAWLLGPVGAPLPLVPGRKTLLKQVAERLGQLLPASTADVPSSLTEALPWLWAIAARTQQPHAAFPLLADFMGKEQPNVGRPWQPHWELLRKSNSYVANWKPGKPTITDTWTELHVSATAGQESATSSLLLYSQHATLQAGQQWYQVAALATDFPFVVALLPHYPAPLHWYVLHQAATRDTPDSTHRALLSLALRSLLGAGAGFDEAATLVLAVGLTHNAPVCRALALEVLLAATQYGRLLPALLGQTLGRLLAAEFVPVARLADLLPQAQGIDTQTDDALRQVLEALLPALPPSPLRNVGKLLTLYADLAARLNCVVPMAVRQQLQAWSTVAALKKIANPLLSLPMNVPPAATLAAAPLGHEEANLVLG
jgi:hypothetical protein